MHNFQQPNSPLLLWNQNRPLFVPYVQGLPPQVQELLPYMATALANEFITKAETNAARMFTYNQMSDRGWNNQEFASAVELMAAGCIMYIQRGIAPNVASAIGILADQIANWITAKNALGFLMQYNLFDQQTLTAAQNLSYEFDQFIAAVGSGGAQQQQPQIQQRGPFNPVTAQFGMNSGGYPGMTGVNNTGLQAFGNKPRESLNKWNQGVAAPTRSMPGPFTPVTQPQSTPQSTQPPAIKTFAEKAANLFSVQPSKGLVEEKQVMGNNQTGIYQEEYSDREDTMDRNQHRLFGIPIDTVGTKEKILESAVAFGHLTKSMEDDPRDPSSMVGEFRQLELKEYQMTSDVVSTGVREAIRIGEYRLMEAKDKKPYIYVTKARILRPIICGGDFTSRILAICGNRLEPLVTFDKFLSMTRDLIRNDSKDPAELSMITQIDLLLSKEVNHILLDVLGIKDLYIDSFLEDVVELRSIVQSDYGDLYANTLTGFLDEFVRYLTAGFKEYSESYKQFAAEIVSESEQAVTTLVPRNYDIIHVDLFSREINMQNKAKTVGFNSNWLRGLMEKVVVSRNTGNVLIVTKDQKIFRAVKDFFGDQPWLIVNYTL
jgi:hypothetical protein